MPDFNDEYEASYREEPRALRDARRIVVAYMFFSEVFFSDRIPMERKLSYFGERLPHVLKEFGCDY